MKQFNVHLKKQRPFILNISVWALVAYLIALFDSYSWEASFDTDIITYLTYTADYIVITVYFLFIYPKTIKSRSLKTIGIQIFFHALYINSIVTLFHWTGNIVMFDVSKVTTEELVFNFLLFFFSIGRLNMLILTYAYFLYFYTSLKDKDQVIRRNTVAGNDLESSRQRLESIALAGETIRQNINVLIDRDPEQARTDIVHYSQFLRYSLKIGRMEKVSVGEEQAFTQLFSKLYDAAIQIHFVEFPIEVRNSDFKLPAGYVMGILIPLMSVGFSSFQIRMTESPKCFLEITCANRGEEYPIDFASLINSLSNKSSTKLNTGSLYSSEFVTSPDKGQFTIRVLINP